MSQLSMQMFKSNWVSRICWVRLPIEWFYSF